MMTEARHTPGPWGWHKRFEDQGRNGSVFSEPRSGHVYAVAMQPQFVSEDQWQADARLIAAAPEMLDALKAVADFYEWNDRSPLAATPRQVLNAIAKATGAE